MPGKRWTDRELALLGTMTDQAVADRTGRRMDCVQRKRAELGIQADSPIDRRAYRWTARRVAMLGTMPDREVAERLGITRNTVIRERLRRRITCFSTINRPH